MAEKVIQENVERLKQEKMKAKSRLTRENNKLQELLQAENTSKNTIKRYINKIKAEFSIIEKIFNKLKELAILENIEQSDSEVEQIENELEEIGVLTDSIIEAAESHIKQRLQNGELESILQTHSDTNSVVESQFSNPDFEQPHHSELSEANNRVTELHEEEIMKEKEVNQKVEELALARQRTQDARKIASIIDARSQTHSTTSQSCENDSPRQTSPQLTNSINQLVNHSVEQQKNISKQTNLDPNTPGFQPGSQSPRHPIPDHDLSEYSMEGNPPRFKQQSNPYPQQATNPSSTNQTPRKAVKLKGVELRVFDGEDKCDYEQWKAAFMSAVDSTDIAVNEKMLRLQNSLKGKALGLVKDLGFSVHAYERAKEKLEKKYGGARRLRIKTLTALKNWKRVQSKNLNELEEFLNVLDRTLIVLKDTGDKPGELFDQSLNLISKEKLPEEEIQRYKVWLIEHSKEDTFETLVRWLELRVQIMEEAKEETKGLGTYKSERNVDQKYYRKTERGFHANSKGSIKCIVQSCSQNHPPWLCEEFKALPVTSRKTLVEKSKRCYRCLGVGHKAAECTRARKCGISGCSSTQHNRLLHRDTPEAVLQSSGSSQEVSETEQTTRSFVNSRTDNVSLMVLPAVARKGSKQLKVNVILDPCSTGSYVTEALAEELQLKGNFQELTIAGAGGSVVKKQSKQVSVIIESTNNKFSESVNANVLGDITGDTPAFEWADIKSAWPHLYSVPFEKVAKRRQIDILIDSDHPLFHRVLNEIHGSTPTDPIARLTHLGWVCFGPTQLEDHRRKSRSHFIRTYRSSLVEQCPDQELRRFWELEALGIKDNNERTLDEREAATKVSDSVVRRRATSEEQLQHGIEEARESGEGTTKKRFRSCAII